MLGIVKIQTALLVVTRVHMQSSSKVPDVQKMVDFILHSSSYADRILICLGTENHLMENYLFDLKEQVKTISSSHENLVIDYLPINPWGYFTYSLNAALLYAQDNGFNRIAFQSVEFRIDRQRVSLLLERSIDHNLLVIGPEMSGHQFSNPAVYIDNNSTSIPCNTPITNSPVAAVPVRGRTVPWNTFAIWDVGALGTTGFPLIGDGVAGRRDIGGVEEVSAINLLQLIDKQRRALLVRFAVKPTLDESANDTTTDTTTDTLKPDIAVESSTSTGVNWHTQFSEDSVRQNYHDEKMRSKDDRPARQQELSGIPAGVVEHVTLYLV